MKPHLSRIAENVHYGDAVLTYDISDSLVPRMHNVPSLPDAIDRRVQHALSGFFECSFGHDHCRGEEIPVSSTVPPNFR